MNPSPKEFLWVEKYRPRKVSDCLLPKAIDKTMRGILKKGSIPNLLLSGAPGSGKTTVARALCEELGVNYLFLNASVESGIDVLRNKITNFASTKSLTNPNSRKAIILDEADYLNPSSTQPALRAFIEDYSANCAFIMTCNYKNKILAPLHSRFSVIDFVIPNDEKVELAKRFATRVLEILNDENIDYDPSVVMTVIKRFFPDYRKTLGELQRFTIDGRIDESVITRSVDHDISGLVPLLRDSNFKGMRKWVGENLDNDPVVVMTKLFQQLYQIMTPNSIPEAVVILNNYQYKAAFVTDQEINMTACLTEIMANCEFVKE